MNLTPCCNLVGLGHPNPTKMETRTLPREKSHDFCRDLAACGSSGPARGGECQRTCKGQNFRWEGVWARGSKAHFSPPRARSPFHTVEPCHTFVACLCCVPFCVVSFPVCKMTLYCGPSHVWHIRMVCLFLTFLAWGPTSYVWHYSLRSPFLVVSLLRCDMILMAVLSMCDITVGSSYMWRA